MLNSLADDIGMPRSVLKTILFVVLALIIFIFFWPFRSVATGTRGVLTQFGAIIKIEPEGMVVVPPWQHVQMFSIRAESAEIKDAPGVTVDQQRVDTSLVVRYNINPDKVSLVYEQYSHDGDLSSYVQTATQETFKAVTAKYTAPELISKRALVSTDIRELLQTKLDIYGAHVINIDMTNFTWSDDYAKAIGQKVTQEQLRQVADNKLKTVESEQKQKVAIADAEASAVRSKASGEADAAVFAANGEAKAILVKAEAQARALTVQNEALSKSKDVLELKRIEVQLALAGEGWKGGVPQYVLGSAPIPFMPMPLPAAAAH